MAKDKTETSDLKDELKRIYALDKAAHPEIYEIQEKDKELARHLAKTDEEIAKVLGK